MNPKTKRIISSTIITLVILLILMIFLGFTISIIVSILLGLASFWLLSGEKAEKTNSNEPVVEESATEQGNQALLTANLSLRKQIVSAELRTQYEQLIDQLIELLPLVNDSENELSWVINRMATEYLPNKSIGPYLNLSEEQRLDSAVISEVIENIDAMKNELLDVKEMITKKNSNEFSQKAQFLKQRFAE